MVIKPAKSRAGSYRLDITLYLNSDTEYYTNYTIILRNERIIKNRLWCWRSGGTVSPKCAAK